MSQEQVETNAQGVKEQLSQFLDFEVKTNPAVTVNNTEWLTSIRMIDFLRDVGNHFTVNYMLSKESVKGRLAKEEGMSFRAFSYMLLQAYDFVVLYDRFNCKLQMGGSDQWGNITVGIDLVRRLRGARVHGLVFPLLTTPAGDKFGKTEKGIVWLDAKLTSPFRFYQFWLNTGDQDVITYLKYFTWLSEDEIQELEESVTNAPEKREAQRRLARETTRMVHGKTVLTRAEQASRVLFGEPIPELNVDEILDVFNDMPSTQMSKSQFEGRGMPIVELLVGCGLASAKGEARRLIQQGGIYLNNRRVTDVQKRISLLDSVGGQVLVVRKGKREYHLVRILGVEP